MLTLIRLVLLAAIMVFLVFTLEDIVRIKHYRHYRYRLNAMLTIARRLSIFDILIAALCGKFVLVTLGLCACAWLLKYYYLESMYDQNYYCLQGGRTKTV